MSSERRTLSEIRTLDEFISLLRERGESIALIELEREQRRDWSAASLAEQARRLAAGFHSEGLEPGTRVLLYAPNSPQWIIACLAIISAGAIPVPVDSQLGERDLRHIAANSGARWALTTKRLANSLQQAAEAQPKLVLLDGNEGGDTDDTDRADQRDHHADASSNDDANTRTAGTHSIARLLRETPDEASDAAPELGGQPDSSAEAVLFYTSGTSGPPKGVPLTHDNLLSNLKAILSQDIVDPSDRLLLPLPLHHVYPFSLGMLAPLALGIGIILPYSLTGPQLVRALKEGEATTMLGIPRLYSALLDAIDRRVAGAGRLASAAFAGLLGLSIAVRQRIGIGLGAPLLAPLRRRVAPKLRLLISGGAALEAKIAWRLDALGWQVATGYGLTETSPILTFLAPPARRFDSAGRALPGVELRIDQTDDRISDQGEIQAKGPNIFCGYLDLPEKTAEIFSDDGWLRTSDLGYIDEQGWLSISGRASARIVLAGGENIDPERIEARLEHCPSVREVGVLGHEGRLAAVIVPEAEAARDQDQDRLRQQISDEITAASRDLASTQQIDSLRLDRSPLPRTRLGKLRRPRLAERFEALSAGAETAPEPGLAAFDDLAPEDRQLLEDQTAHRVWRWLGERFSDRPITTDADLRLDLGVDSLEWVDLTLDLQQQVGLALDEEAIGRIKRVRDLLQEAMEAEQTAVTGATLIERLQDPEAQLNETERQRLSPPPAPLRWLATLLHALVRQILRGPFRLQVRGTEQIPTSGACLLTPNHLSAVDPGAILAVLDHARRRTTCWGGATAILFNRPWMRLLSRSMRVLPVDPSGNPLTSLALGAAALKQGCMLIWFPEGRRSPDGALQPFRSGVGSLALARKVPILPVHLSGTREALPPGSLRLRPRPVELRIGAPVDAETLAREGQGEDDAARIANALQERVRALGAGADEA
ncbi:MAG: AMP-binding protein [Lamprobacter sp.]|uniref:AMP-binding protein n=1 Tax=Lamprobacter sp. TaxID=3100796 RepID=UPI002B258AF8|nr:AMP-binding protein [Lamprobacter sp.]MEA3641640.1 AMP-binding protein [Lamprobacter sp.]